MNISRSTKIQHVYRVAKTPSTLFLTVDLAPISLHALLLNPPCNKCTSDDQHPGSIDDTIFVTKLSTLELSGRCVLQIYLLTYLLSRIRN